MLNRTEKTIKKEKEPFIQKIKGFGKLLIDSGNGFAEDNCMKLSASLAYYTVFSIGPLIIILVWALGFFYGSQLEGPDGAQNKVMTELNELFGREIAKLLDNAVRQISLENKSSIGLLIGIITLVMTSTTIFVDIQNSINLIWKVKAKPKKGWLKMIINRLISFSMILGLSFLLIASLLISSIIGIITKNIELILDKWNIQHLDIQFWNWVNNGITFVVIVILFGFIFAFLPDAKVRFKDILGGSIFTTLLFMIGKYGISLYLSYNATATAYGAAGSIIILLAFVYYSAAILYFGAEFTKEYAIRYGRGITPASYAVLVKQTELEIDPETGKRELVKKHNEPVQ
ncbi:MULTISPECIES: YihY/virulence factor BrkB family protein [Sphingobacterium]|uniref:YihY/virulence factor BrkB family protein n=1 Tax=Sphingobacterium litopenaei TaxID=2763500 RepID=A0ABR7YGE8_9SPHI|nr:MULTISPECIES: YihY/virulence factor BrkB family protein [Sphingobacterium]MBD1430288.1 YihY/virulence factor BrkB family protein [Sphingobacterium litopenaei]NGM74471.1 YihY/virulence factor BrkB family protein [Sphingobacterium sp. SGL-16]